MSRPMNRRQFIKGSLAAGLGAGGLSGCSTMDRFFGLEKSKFDQEVLIVGAGAAGLAAAYELKKAGVPYRVFEASPRVGGRVYTLENFNSDGQLAELGAEYFEDNHKLIFDWCKELNLPIDEITWPSGLDSQVTYSRGQLLPARELNPRLQKLITELVRMKLEVVGDRNEVVSSQNFQDFPKALNYDQMSMDVYLDRMLGRVDPEVLKIFKSSCIAQFGMRLEELSALHLINSIDLEAGPNRPIYRVRYGNQRLLRTIYERISGVLPDFFVKVDSPLVSIEEKGQYFHCKFKTPQGNRTYEAKYVIMALPINQYKNIEGFNNLKISQTKKEGSRRIDLASHSKIVMSFKNRFWLKKQDGTPANRGSYVRDIWPQMTWDTSAGQEGVRGIMSFLLGGPQAEAGAGLIPENLLQGMQVFGKAFISESEGLFQVMNWKEKAFTRGSFVYYKPGDFLKYHGIWSESDYQGRLSYAGEHTHLSRYGTWIGALESGQKAAQSIIEIQKSKVKTI